MKKILLPILLLAATFLKAGDLKQSFPLPYMSFTPGIFHVTASPTPAYISGSFIINPALAWKNPTGQTIYIKKTTMWFRPEGVDTLVIGWIQRHSDGSMLAYVPLKDEYADVESFDTDYFTLGPSDSLDFTYYSVAQAAVSVIMWYTVGEP